LGASFAIMKKSDIYPSASEEDLINLPPQVRVWGLHPLVWVAVVVLLIAVGRACSTVDDLGCGWEWWEHDEHSSEEDKRSDDHESDDSERSDDDTDSEDSSKAAVAPKKDDD